VVTAALAEIRPTDHAVERYRRRMRQPRATREDVAAVIAAGRFRLDPPDGRDGAREHDTFGYVVTDRAIFPVERSGVDFVAVTCLKRTRRSKEERRALREVAREAFGF
jgi:hypothetical protein